MESTALNGKPRPQRPEHAGKRGAFIGELLLTFGGECGVLLLPESGERRRTPRRTDLLGRQQEAVGEGCADSSLAGVPSRRRNVSDREAHRLHLAGLREAQRGDSRGVAPRGGDPGPGGSGGRLPGPFRPPCYRSSCRFRQAHQSSSRSFSLSRLARSSSGEGGRPR